jgi:hypothetical protein
LKVKLSKCKFLQASIEYLGFMISKSIHALDKPTDAKEVQTLMGFLSNNARFIPSMADIMNPISELTKKGHRLSGRMNDRWSWRG